MNQIDVTYSALLAGSLYDECIAPLAAARREADAPPYFALGRDPSAASYFELPPLGVARPEDLDRPEMAGAEALVDALAAHWTAEGETALAAMAPRLLAIAKALGEEQAEQGDAVDILCYTMF